MPGEHTGIWNASRNSWKVCKRYNHPHETGNLRKDIFIRADAATVINIIADYSNHYKIHPLITKVERATDEPEGVRRYFITDSLQWGPFQFKIKYQADIIAVTDDTVHTEAYQSPSTYDQSNTER